MQSEDNIGEMDSSVIGVASGDNCRLPCPLPRATATRSAGDPINENKLRAMSQWWQFTIAIISLHSSSRGLLLATAGDLNYAFAFGKVDAEDSTESSIRSGHLLNIAFLPRDHGAQAAALIDDDMSAMEATASRSQCQWDSSQKPLFLCFHQIMPRLTLRHHYATRELRIAFSVGPSKPAITSWSKNAPAWE